MKTIRVLGIVLGTAFIAIWGYKFFTEHYSALGSLMGMGVGALFLVYGIKGKDLVEVFFKKLTGRSLNSGT